MTKEVESDFELAILSQISRYLDKSEGFFDLCRSLMGPTPIEILEIAKHDELIFKKVQNLSKIRTSLSPNCIDIHSFCEEKLPEPLLIDADWRYTSQSAKDIVDISDLKSGKRSLCLGSPTVFSQLLKNNLDCLMIDRNSLICDHFRRYGKHNVICADLNKLDIVSFIKGFDAVFLDPPWYMTHVYHWLAVAVGVTKAKGSIYMPMFTDNLRPRAKFEIQTFLGILHEIGVEHEVISTVDYVVPNYEKVVFEHHNVSEPTSWRRANLLRLEISSSNVESAISSLKQAGGPTPEEFFWKRFQIGKKSYAVDARVLSMDCGYRGKLIFKDSISSRSKNKQRFNFIDSENNISQIRRICYRTNKSQPDVCAELNDGKICLDIAANHGEIYAEYSNSSLS